MILEVAILDVKNGLEIEFQKNFTLARQYISAAVGYKGHSLRKCMERPSRYILLVEWKIWKVTKLDFENLMSTKNGKHYCINITIHFQQLNITKQFTRITFKKP